MRRSSVRVVCAEPVAWGGLRVAVDAAGLRLTELKESAAREISTAKHRAAADVSNAKLYSSQAFATDLLDVVSHSPCRA